MPAAVPAFAETLRAGKYFGRRALFDLVIHYNERRLFYGNTHSLGDIPHHGKSESKEGEEIDLDGLLQQSLNWLPTAGSCYLSRFQCLCFCGEEFYPPPGRF